MWSLGTHVEAQAGAVFGLDSHKLDTGIKDFNEHVKSSWQTAVFRIAMHLIALLLHIFIHAFSISRPSPHVLQSRSQDCLTVREHSLTFQNHGWYSMLASWSSLTSLVEGYPSSLLLLRKVESLGKAPFQHQFAHQFAVSSVHFSVLTFRTDTVGTWKKENRSFFMQRTQWLWSQLRQGGDGLLRSPETCDDGNTGKGAKGLAVDGLLCELCDQDIYFENLRIFQNPWAVGCI